MSSKKRRTRSTTVDAEMADYEDEKVVTMMDVLKEQQDFEDDANAVLGASDDRNCTYPKGYIKRQAIYACLTCCPEAKSDPAKRAGVCLACSLSCHENHELVELYTKRNFRCDCGNPKFKSHPCQFTSKKTDLNEENEYNQNFSGLYCVCHRPYPDPESPDEEEMIQCIICEDWLHASHLDAIVPAIDQYSEMICKSCMDKNYFLHDYSNMAVVAEADVDMSMNDTKTSCNNESSICNDMNKNELKGDLVTDGSDDQKIKEGEVINKKCYEEKTDITNSNITTDNNDETSHDKKEENNKDKIDEQASKYSTSDVENNLDQDDELKNRDKMQAETTNEDKTLIIGVTHDNSSTSNDKDASTTNKDETISTFDSTLSDASTHNFVEKEETKEDQSKSELGEYNSAVEKSKTPEIDSQSKPGESLQGLITDTTDIAVNKADTTYTTGISENTAAETAINNKCETNIPTEESTDLNINEQKRKLSTEEKNSESSAKKQKTEKKCFRPDGVKRIFKGATFWTSNFRQKLCICYTCIEMYKDLSLLFLIDLDDTVTAYENLGIERNNGSPASQYEKGLQALSSLDRVQQINALTEYNKMRDKLLDFLKSFKDRKEIVKEEDIKAFFAGMKPKREPDGVYFCR